jgi:hypothetical protein
MTDIQLNGQSITTTSATTAPSAGTSESWTVTALAAGIPTLGTGQTYALVDATPGATAAQQTEIQRITAATAGGTTITVTRGADGTTPVAHAATSVFNIVVVRSYLNSTRNGGAPSYAPEILANQFDPRRSIYNWKSSNTRWLRRGLAIAARGGKSDHICIGDSITAGAVSGIGTTLYDRPNAWPIAMRNALAGMGVPVGGTGIVRPIDNASTDARYSSTGTWGNNGVYIFSTTVSSTLTFTPDSSGTIADVQYYDGAAGTFTISVNGVVVRTVTGSGSGSAWKHARITGQNIVANLTKIVLTQTVVNTTGIIIAGINVYTPNGGLIIHNVAQSGSRASGNTGVNSWTDTTSTGNSASPYKTFGDSGGRSRQVTDAVFNATTTVTSATANFTNDDIGSPLDQNAVPTAGIILPENTYIASVTNSTTAIMNQAAYVSATTQTVTINRDPHVVHLAIGGNDMIQLGITSLAATTAAITTLRNLYPNSDAILHLFHNITTTLVSQADQDSFAAAFYQLADTLDIPLFDWRDRVGTYAQAQANGIMGDYQVHLKGSGYAMIGSLLAEVIGESAGKTQGVFTPTQDTDFTNKIYVDNLTTAWTWAFGPDTAATTERVVGSRKIPANSLKVGSSIDFQQFIRVGATSITTTRIRIGTTGTTADAAVVTIAATAATNAAARWVEGVATVLAIGASGNFLGGGVENVGAIAATGTQTATSGTFDTTKDLFITVTVQTTSSVTLATSGRAELTY